MASRRPPLTPDEIPENTFGLNSFSSLIVADATTGRWTTGQRAALADWVARGGQLVVNVGSLESLTVVYGELKRLAGAVDVLLVHLSRGVEQMETLRFEAVNPTFVLHVGKTAEEPVQGMGL